jgi:hypothetical protein
MRVIAVLSGIAFLIAASLVAQPAEARQVAVCQDGFKVRVVGGGTQADCFRTKKEWRDHARRQCPPLMTYSPGREADDGGDLCSPGGGQAGAVPALPCGIGERIRLIRGQPDQCQQQVEVDEFGTITIRNQ